VVRIAHARGTMLQGDVFAAITGHKMRFSPRSDAYRTRTAGWLQRPPPRHACLGLMTNLKFTLECVNVDETLLGDDALTCDESWRQRPPARQQAPDQVAHLSGAQGKWRRESSVQRLHCSQNTLGAWAGTCLLDSLARDGFAGYDSAGLAGRS